MSRSRRPSTRRALALATSTLTFAAVAVAASASGATPVPTVTGLSPTAGGAGTAISIAGTGFASTSTVLVGTVAATKVVEQSTTLLQATIPSGPSGTVDVTVTTSGAGTSTTSSADRFTYVAAPKNLTWTKQYNADLSSGSPQGVSCPGVHTCRAGDSYGNSIVYDGHWKAPARSVNGALQGIDCTSPSHCLALDNGAVTTFNGHGWSTPRQALSGVNLNALDCPSATVCFGVSYGDGWYRYDGHSWSIIRKRADGSMISPRSLSCPTPTFCLAVGYAGFFQTLRSGTVGAVDAVGTATLPSISCLPSHACVALLKPSGTQALRARRFDGTHWHSPVDLGVIGRSIGQVSCPSSSFCAVGAGKYGIVTKGPGLTGMHHSKLATAGMADLACATSKACETLDVTGRSYRWNGHHWSSGHDTDPVHGGIQDLSCWTVSDCLAVDEHGYAIRRNVSSWAATHIDPRGDLTAIGCAADGTCAATDKSGVSFVYEHSRWSSGTRVFRGGYQRHVSCASSTLCISASSNGNAAEWNGTTWSAPAPVGNGEEIYSVSCASDGTCVAIQYDSSGNRLLRRTGPGHWSSTQLPVSNGDVAIAVDCRSATTCVVQLAPTSGETGAFGVLYLTGTLWSPEQFFSTDQTDQNAGGLSCPSVRYCATIDSSESAENLDVFNAAGNLHSFPGVTVNEDNHLTGFSCPAVANCLVTNDEGVSRGT